MPSLTAEPLNADLERAELQSVLQAQLFVRCPTLAHLLAYLCEKKFALQTNQIKEYSIALDVFGRRESFDQDTDSIVRVQVNRLRKRLTDFYNSEGATHDLRITIPVGHYVPLFEKVNPQAEVSDQRSPVPLSSNRVAADRKWGVGVSVLLILSIVLAGWRLCSLG